MIVVIRWLIGVNNGVPLPGVALATASVITISSHTTGLFFPRHGLYDGAKGALEQFSRVFSKEIADVVAFLASPQVGWVAGQNLRVNGGVV